MLKLSEQCGQEIFPCGGRTTDQQFATYLIIDILYTILKETRGEQNFPDHGQDGLSGFTEFNRSAVTDE